MAPWHAILRATPFAPSSPCAQGDILSPSEPYLLPAMRNPCAAKIDSALAIRESGRRSGTPGALAYMVAANLRPRALGAVARELNRRQVPQLASRVRHRRARPQTRHVPRRFQHALVEVEPSVSSFVWLRSTRPRMYRRVKGPSRFPASGAGFRLSGCAGRAGRDHGCFLQRFGELIPIGGNQ
jgi:hypothetical protein